MPKRVLDFDAMWGSDKLASCATWAQAEYAWLYGLADASGCFELTNLRVIWGRVAAIRVNLTLERLEQIFAEFQDKGLLFVWEHEGKRYGHWTGSDVPGRLPPPSWRMRLERLSPPVPKQQLAQYMARFARGRAGLAGVGFHGGTPAAAADRQEHFKFEISDLRFANPDRKEARGGNFAADERGGPGGAPPRRLTPCLEEHQGQDLGLVRDSDVDGDSGWNGNAGLPGDSGLHGNLVGDGKDELGEAGLAPGSSMSRREVSATGFQPASSHSVANPDVAPQGNARVHSERMSARDLAVQRELRVGQGPVCAPGSVRKEVIERDRLRRAARAGCTP